MSTVVFDEGQVHIPAWVVDLASFRRWVHSDDFPEKGRICFLNGEVWADLSKEQFFSHNQVKNELASVLGKLVKANRLGRFIPDGMLLSHVGANLTAQPDGAFISRDSFQAGRVQLVEGAEEGCVEIEGTPDMVLEVISTSSVHKDTVVLRDQYWQAGIREYWLVDARGDRLAFDILRHTAKEYVVTRKQAGWLKSTAFGKSFRLTRQADDLGNPDYTLEVRS
jgi:Uma2 family endonuclease